MEAPVLHPIVVHAGQGALEKDAKYVRRKSFEICPFSSFLDVRV